MELRGSCCTIKSGKTAPKNIPYTSQYWTHSWLNIASTCSKWVKPAGRIPGLAGSSPACPVALPSPNVPSQHCAAGTCGMSARMLSFKYQLSIPAFNEAAHRSPDFSVFPLQKLNTKLERMFNTQSHSSSSGKVLQFSGLGSWESSWSLSWILCAFHLAFWLPYVLNGVP